MKTFLAIARIGLALACVFCTTGCMALVTGPGLQELGSLSGDTGGAFSGIAGTQSTVAVNKSWMDINRVMKRYTRLQMANLEQQRLEQQRVRDTVVGILKDVNASRGGDPAIVDLIAWVKAGGDPQAALTYALNSQAQWEKDTRLKDTTLALLKGMEDQPQADADIPMLIAWVRAGGDPQYALDHALNHRAKAPPAPAQGRAPQTPPAPQKPPQAPSGQTFSAR